MRQMILIILLLSVASTNAIGIVLGECVQIYTGSSVYHFIFQVGFTFLASLFVSHFIVQNYVKPLWN